MGFVRIFSAVAAFSQLFGCDTEAGSATTAGSAGRYEGDTIYVVTRHDERKCMAPMCGGWYVKAVNKTKTTCFDGTKAADCYVSEIDLSALELPALQNEQVGYGVLAGTVLVSGEYTDVGYNSAKLTGYKAFERRTDAAPTGTHYLLASSGIVCITTPCPSLQTTKLNSNEVKALTDVDFSRLALAPEELDATITSVYETGLVTSGIIKKDGNRKYLEVSQVFDTVESEIQYCLGNDDCPAEAHCDQSECLMPECPPDMSCPQVCYGDCEPGAPVNEASCANACGGTSIDASCYCDGECEYYGDCCSDYVEQCGA